MSRAPAPARNRPQTAATALETPNRGHFAPIFSKFLCPGGRYEADSAREIVGVLVSAAGKIVGVLVFAFVEELQFIDGFSIDVAPAFSNSQTKRLARYRVYERGHNNVVVLLELTQVPDSGELNVDDDGQFYATGGRDGYAKVSVYDANPQ